MIKKAFLSLAILFVGLGGWAQNQEFLNYIEKYSDLAIQEMERAGIPASIKLAQGLLESSAGKSYLARRGNNHFGIKCGSNWEGKKVYKEDDDFDENGKLIKSCFRSYRNVKASYIAHSEFLRDPRKTHRYGFLFRLDPTDYRRWARGLKRAGYATSATYDKKLIRLIETYELHKFDTSIPIDIIDDPIVDTGSGSNSAIQQSVNDVKYFIAQDGELVSDLSRRADISVRSIIKYNERIDSGSEALKKGTRVYVQPKRKSYRGKKLNHKVEAGQTMFFISQMYAVKLSKLYSCNLMDDDTEPAVGEVIKLKGKAKTRPKLSTETDDETEELEMIEEDKEEVITTDPEPKKEEKTQAEEEILPPIPNAPVKEEQPVEEKIEKPEVKPEEKNPEFEEEIKFEEQPETKNTEEEEEEEFLPGFDDVEVEEPKEEKPVEVPPVVKEETPPPPPVVEEPEEEIKEEPVIEDPVETPPVDAVFYTVERGDTLWAISQKFDTTVEELRRLNNIDGNFIRRGVRIRVK